MSELSKAESHQESHPAIDTRPAPIVDRNVRAMVELAAEQERAKTLEKRIAEGISRFAGTMSFVYFHIVVFGLWTLEDLGWLPGIHGYDTSFTVLGTVASIEAIFLATFVLIAQNRMSKQADIRNHLDLQVGLLTEQETTHILRIVAAMSEKMGLDAARDPEMRELLREVAPQAMLEKIEEHAEAVAKEIHADSGSL